MEVESHKCMMCSGFSAKLHTKTDCLQRVYNYYFCSDKCKENYFLSVIVEKHEPDSEGYY